MSESLKPFSRGDVFVGATELNDPLDDHAGRGRIIHAPQSGERVEIQSLASRSGGVSSSMSRCRRPCLLVVGY